MCGLLVVTRLMVLAGLTMMFGSVFIVLRGLFVMLVNLELCHFVLRTFPDAKKGPNGLGIQLKRQIVYELIGRRAVWRTLSTRLRRRCPEVTNFLFLGKAACEGPEASCL